MLQLLHPAALWTLAALALPLAIHLRRPPPRTVRLGSLRFLENVPRRPWRNPRWREWLLLCVRLALLAALALLLAEPRWVETPPAGPRRWALLDPTAALTGDALARWRAARANGFEPRRLAPGFPAVSDEPSAGSVEHGTPDLWSLLREADAELPAGSVLAVFSPGRLAVLQGTRPALGHCKVEWVSTPEEENGQPHVWVASGWKERVVAGRSDARSTVFAVGALSAPVVFPTHEDEHWRTEPGDDKPGATRFLHDDHPRPHAADPWAVELPPSAVSVLILHDAGHAAATQWTFWLSTRPVPEGLAARAPRIVRYAGGDPVAADDRIVAPPDDAVGGTRLRKRANPRDQRAAGTVWWSDGQGNPLLSYSHPASGELWDMYTRFDPEWTDLPRTTALPAWVRARLFPETVALSATDPLHDRRLSDPSQGRPSETGVAATIPILAPANQPFRDLRWPLWIVAATLFLLERILSLRRPTEPSVATSVQSAPFAAARR